MGDHLVLNALTPLPFETRTPLHAWHSLRVRLPLLISALIVAAVAAFLWAAHREVEVALVQAGYGRATSAADQVAGLMERPFQTGMENLRRVAEDAAVRHFLQQPSEDAARQAARARLVPLAPTGPRRIEVWSADGSRLLEISIPGAPDPSAVARSVPPASRPSHVGFSPLQSADGKVFFDLVAAIPAEPPPVRSADTPVPGGYLVLRSTFQLSPPGIVSRLVGDDALVVIGNRTGGGVWTNLSTTVPGPPVSVSRSGVEEYRDAGGQRHLGAVSLVDGTPWAVWVEFPRSLIVAPARVFLRRMVVVALVFVAIGALLVGRLSVRITRPLHELARAADEIAAGDYSRRVAPTRNDEIGRLGLAFNEMAADVGIALEAMRRNQELRLKHQAIEEQNRRMLEANRLKSEFVANMSHELRTPLNAIIGFADFMYKGKAGATSPAHQEYLGDILTSSRHLLQLINDVLDLAKVESGKMEFRPEPVDLAKAVNEVRDILREPDATTCLRIDAEVDPAVGTVVIDPARLKQILYNFLSNAIKFTPDGGRIDVRIAPEGLDMFRIDVEDTGVGIAAEDFEKLFVEFQQLDSGAAKRHQGTGLGLALTKRLVESQGGRVAVRSSPGEGSRFSAILPRVMSPARATATEVARGA